MKKILMCVAVLSMVWAGPAMAGTIDVGNHSFELPTQGKIPCWDGVCTDPGGPGVYPDVPNWNSDTAVFDSGVEPGGIALTDGDYQGFLMQQDPSVWNLTDHVITASDVFTLSVDASTGKSGGVNFEMTLYYDVAGTRFVGATQTVLVPKGSIPTFNLVFDVNDDMPAAVGYPIGIELNDVGSSGANSWMGMDNVRLTVIPEPSSMMLLGLGLLALLVRRRM